MDNNDIPPSASAPSNPNTTMNESPQKYVPQFSAATEMILKRINSGAGATGLSSLGGSAPYMGGTAKYEDMRRTVLKAMKTSMNIELPRMPASGSARSKAAPGKSGSAGMPKASSNTPGATPSASGSASGGKRKGKGRGRPRAGTKRKRAQEDESESTEESDEMSQLGGDSEEDEVDEEDISELPKITQSGRQINKPAHFVPASYETPSKKRVQQPKRSQEQALCKRCARGHSPQNNMIVFCDGCNLCWHQLCHDPAISEDTVKDEAAPWYCADCTRKRGLGVKTAGHEQVRGVSWQGRSDNDKRNYFQSLPHNHLVSLLMQATILHPNIPIFPGEQLKQPAPPQAKPISVRASSQSQQPFPPSALSAAGLFTRSESNPRGSMNFVRKIPPGSVPPPAANSSVSATAQFAPANPPPSKQNSHPPANPDSRESTPASPPYPKPGNGLMAKLGPDDEDMEWLVDENDFDAFSHTVYDEQGNPQALQGDADLGLGINGGSAHGHNV